MKKKECKKSETDLGRETWTDPPRYPRAYHMAGKMARTIRRICWKHVR